MVLGNEVEWTPYLDLKLVGRSIGWSVWMVSSIYSLLFFFNGWSGWSTDQLVGLVSLFLFIFFLLVE